MAVFLPPVVFSPRVLKVFVTRIVNGSRIHTNKYIIRLVHFSYLYSLAMFPSTVMSNSTSLSEEASGSSVTRVQDFGSLNPMVQTISSQQPQKIKKKRNLPGNPGDQFLIFTNSKKSVFV